MKSPSFDLPQGILKWNQMSIGFSSKFYMVFVGGRVIGMRKLTKFSSPSASLHPSKILAFTLDSSSIPTILTPLSQQFLCHLGCTLMTLPTSPKIPHPSVEDLLCHLLGERCNVDFLGIVKWFLGIHFSWRISP
jgi:hypothetical protein